MNKFLTYCNTKQYFTNHWIGDVFDNNIHISTNELQRFGLTWNSIKDSPYLKQNEKGRFNVSNINTIDISLLKKHGRPLTDLHKWMLERVCETELPESIETTPYWKTFLKHRLNYPTLFFTVDQFSGRVHTPISGMSKNLRPYLLLRGEKTCSLDVFCMQPTLLANILFKNVGENAFSKAIFESVDVYTMLQSKAGLNTRDEAKKQFFEMLFSKPSRKLEKLFDGENFIQWINKYKSTIEPRNPHGKEKPYSNLAFLLQSYEVMVMGAIWRKLAENGIPFLTVHDEIICRQSDKNEVEIIMKNELTKHFKTFKINTK